MPMREKIAANTRDGGKWRSPQHIENKREHAGLVQIKMSNGEELDIFIGGGVAPRVSLESLQRALAAKGNQR